MKLEGRSLMIVAHPDDELIFGYRTLLDNPDITIICMTNEMDQIRHSEFKNSCEAMKVKEYLIWSFPDGWDESFLEIEAVESLRSYISEFDNIVTHNETGEYGHVQHKSLHNIVKNLVSQTDKDLYVFDKSIPLPYDLLVDKLQLIKKIYNSEYSKGTFDRHYPEQPLNRIMNWIVCESLQKVDI